MISLLMVRLMVECLYHVHLCEPLSHMYCNLTAWPSTVIPSLNDTMS